MKAPSDNSAKRREYIRPDESEVEAHTAWLITKAPASRTRLVELLSGWSGGTCLLCQTDVDLDLAGTHPGRWNIDHIIPKSLGGEWVFGNLRLVHRACNMQRNDMSLPEPDAALYGHLLLAAIDKFERPTEHVESEIERLRWVAHTRVAMVGMETRIVAWNLENSIDEEFKQRVREHIARFQQCADEAIRAVGIFQANMRSGERLSTSGLIQRATPTSPARIALASGAPPRRR